MSIFSLRKAALDDALLLFEWANETGTRKNSFNTEAITWNEHKRWIRDSINDKNTDLYICCTNGKPVGQVRLNCTEDTGMISYSIAKEFRGEGIGNIIVGLIEEEALSAFPQISTMTGNVKHENTASRMIFERRGFSQKYITSEQPYIKFSKIIRLPLNPVRIGIRTDANCMVASGHMSRCLAIAEGIKKYGSDCVFFVSDEESADIVSGGGFKAVTLNPDMHYTEKETIILLEYMELNKIDLLLIDSYFVKPEYFTKLHGVRTAYIDDFGTEAYPSDVIINYNAYARTILYDIMYSGSGTELLLGSGFVPLREEFRLSNPKSIREWVSDILITTGSTDPYGVSRALTNRLLKESTFDGVRIHITAGRYYENISAMEEEFRDEPNVIIHKNVEKMSELAAVSDIAVTAGGTTVYELCACGVPSGIFSFADNQTRTREYMGKLSVAIDCGDIRVGDKECLGAIVGALKLLESPVKRKQIQEKALKVTDGFGALRIAAYLIGKAAERSN